MSLWPFARRRQQRQADELARWGAQQAFVAAVVREPELFWFTAPPTCSLDGAREMFVHEAPAYAGDVAEVLEFPIVRGWDERSILTTIAEIEAL